MPSINDVFAGDYLNAGDLRGRAVKVEIESVAPKEFEDGRKLVIRFKGKKKALVCNKTNARILAHDYGDDYEQWVGVETVLETQPVEYKGSTVDGLRFRPTRPIEPQAGEELGF